MFIEELYAIQYRNKGKICQMKLFNNEIIYQGLFGCVDWFYNVYTYSDPIKLSSYALNQFGVFDTNSQTYMIVKYPKEIEWVRPLGPRV